MKKHVTVIALLLVFASCLPLAAGTFSFIYYPRPVEWLDQYSQIGTALRNLIAQLDDYAATIITTYVPYTGATTNVNLGTKTITSTAAVGFVGTATVALTSPFATNATNSHKVDGYHVGHTSGTVPLADGTVCVGLTVDEDNVILDYLGASPYRNLSDWINVEDSSGLISGGTVVDNGDGTINVAQGEGRLRTTNVPLGEATFIRFGPKTALALTPNALNYVYVDYNSGSIEVKATTTVGTANADTGFILGQYYLEGTDADGVFASNLIPNARTRNMTRLRLRGIEHMDGAVISAYGTRGFQSTDGIFYLGESRIDTGAENTTTDKFDDYYYTGAAWAKLADQTSIDSTIYNNIASGTAELTVNRYALRWVYVCMEGELYTVMGRGDYTLAQAQAAQPSTIPDYLYYNAKLAAKIIIQKNAASFYSLEDAWGTNKFTGATVSDHNGLAGLQGGAATDYYHLTSAQSASLLAHYVKTAQGTHDSTSENIVSKIVHRDSSGNFKAGTITANLTGNASGSSGSCTGNAATATKAAGVESIQDVIYTADSNADENANHIFYEGTNEVGRITTTGNYTAQGTVYGTNLAVYDNTTKTESVYLPWYASAVTQLQPPFVSSTRLSFVPLTGVLTATRFSGPLTGNVTGVADSATAPNSVDITTNAAYYPLFAPLSDGVTTGFRISSGKLTYNPGTGMLATTGFTGAVTGNCSGSSGSCTGNSATATRAATLTGYTMPRTVGHSSGNIPLADGTEVVGLVAASATTASACSGNTAGSSGSCTGNSVTATTATRANSLTGYTIPRVVGKTANTIPFSDGSLSVGLNSELWGGDAQPADAAGYLKNTAGTLSWDSPTAAPAGATTQVQYNDGGAMAGDADFTWTKGTNTLAATNITGALTGNVTGLASSATTAAACTGNTATGSAAALTLGNSEGSLSIDANNATMNSFTSSGGSYFGTTANTYFASGGNAIVYSAGDVYICPDNDSGGVQTCFWYFDTVTDLDMKLVEDDGLYTVGGVVKNVSDERLKTNFVMSNSSDSLNRVCSIDVYDYNWKIELAHSEMSKDTVRKEKGVKAQQLKTVFPNLVGETKADTVEAAVAKSKTILSVGYGHEFTATMIDCVKELKRLNDEQSKRIDDLESRLAKLEGR